MIVVLMMYVSFKSCVSAKVKRYPKASQQTKLHYSNYLSSFTGHTHSSTKKDCVTFTAL